MSDMVHAIPVVRGCGTRKQGGIYAECGLSPNGSPIETFLFDPPILVPADLRVPAIGVTTIERDGVTHIVDRVGMADYPNVADMVEEIRRFGLSRRIPSTFSFEKLTPESRIFLVHDRAWVSPMSIYQEWFCPKHMPSHAPEMAPDICSGVWWQDVVLGEPVAGVNDPRLVLRKMPSFTYTARARPAASDIQERQAFFASFPLSRLAVVRGDHAHALERARKAHVAVDEVDQ